MVMIARDPTRTICPARFPGPTPMPDTSPRGFAYTRDQFQQLAEDALALARTLNIGHGSKVFRKFVYLEVVCG